MGPRRCSRSDDRRGSDRLETRDVNDVQSPKSRVQSRDALAVALIGIAALTTEGNAAPPRKIAIRVSDGLSLGQELTEEERAGVRWRFRDSERASVARWEPVLKRHLGKAPSAPLLVHPFPAPRTSAPPTATSRPADPP